MAMSGITTELDSTLFTHASAHAAKVSAGSGETANARAYKALKEAVHSSTFESGEILTLRRLTKMLGFGAMPVREAIKRLISEGAFEGLPNRSARVPVLERREIQQLADLRFLRRRRMNGKVFKFVSAFQIGVCADAHVFDNLAILYHCPVADAPVSGG